MKEEAKSSSKSARQERLFYACWTVLCATLVVYGLNLLWKPLITMTWETVPCRIERFEIVDDRSSPKPFRADLVFHYQVNGTLFTGTRLWPREKTSRYYDGISEIREELAKGQSGSKEGVVTECRVNRADPSQASLRLEPWESIGKGLVMVLGGSLFVIFGAVSFVDSTKQPLRTLVVTLLGGGCLTMAGTLINQCLEISEKHGWEETPARVIWSRVAKPSEANTKVRIPELFYTYEIGGRPYHSNRYDVTKTYTRGKVQQIVAASPTGSALKVYVDPEKPWRAVVDRNQGQLPLLAGCAVALIVAGGLGSRWLLKVMKRSQPAPLPSPRQPRRAKTPRNKSGGKW